MKTVSSEKRQNCQSEATEAHLKNIQKTVNVVVSLVNLCRSHEKVTNFVAMYHEYCACNQSDKCNFDGVIMT